jgi:hypothetical protein
MSREDHALVLKTEAFWMVKCNAETTRSYVPFDLKAWMVYVLMRGFYCRRLGTSGPRYFWGSDERDEACVTRKLKEVYETTELAVSSH